MPIGLVTESALRGAGDAWRGGPDLVTYAVVDAQTGTTLSSHGTFDAARAEVRETAAEIPEQVSIYVFDDTGHVAGECACCPD
jgi:hypothetical protein